MDGRTGPAEPGPAEPGPAAAEHWRSVPRLLYKAQRRRRRMSLQNLGTRLSAAFLSGRVPADLKPAVLASFPTAAYVSVSVAASNGLLLTTGNLRVAGMVHFTLLCANGSAAGQTLRSGVANCFARGAVPSPLADLEAVHSSRGCGLLVCVPIRAPPRPQAPQAQLAGGAASDAASSPPLSRCCVLGAEGGGPPLGVLSVGMLEDVHLNAFAKYRLERELKVLADYLAGCLVRRCGAAEATVASLTAEPFELACSCPVHAVRPIAAPAAQQPTAPPLPDEDATPPVTPPGAGDVGAPAGALSPEETYARWHARRPRCAADEVANPFEALRDAMARMKSVDVSTSAVIDSAMPPWCPADDVMNPFESLRNALAVMAAGLEPHLSAAPPPCGADDVVNPFELYHSAPLAGAADWPLAVRAPPPAAELGLSSSTLASLEPVLSASPPRNPANLYANPFESYRSAPEPETSPYSGAAGPLRRVSTPNSAGGIAGSPIENPFAKLFAQMPPASPALVQGAAVPPASAPATSGWVTPAGAGSTAATPRAHAASAVVDPFVAALDAVGARTATLMNLTRPAKVSRSPSAPIVIPAAHSELAEQPKSDFDVQIAGQGGSQSTGTLGMSLGETDSDRSSSMASLTMQGSLPQPRASMAFLEHQTLQQQASTALHRPPASQGRLCAANVSASATALASTTLLRPEPGLLPFRAGLREVFEIGPEDTAEQGQPQFGPQALRPPRLPSALPGIAEVRAGGDGARAAPHPLAPSLLLQRQRSLHPSLAGEAAGLKAKSTTAPLGRIPPRPQNMPLALHTAQRSAQLNSQLSAPLGASWGQPIATCMSSSLESAAPPPGGRQSSLPAPRALAPLPFASSKLLPSAANAGKAPWFEGPPERRWHSAPVACEAGDLPAFAAIKQGGFWLGFQDARIEQRFCRWQASTLTMMDFWFVIVALVHITLTVASGMAGDWSSWAHHSVVVVLPLLAMYLSPSWYADNRWWLVRGVVGHTLAINLWDVAAQRALSGDAAAMPWFLWLSNVSGVEALLLSSIASLVPFQRYMQTQAVMVAMALAALPGSCAAWFPQGPQLGCPVAIGLFTVLAGGALPAAAVWAAERTSRQTFLTTLGYSRNAKTGAYERRAGPREAAGSSGAWPAC